ncbi:MAG TPA: DeoR family transcriptional regulator, partial [bacterium]|nr:DeoR family transcriptional regulator [bacterium]
MEKRMSISIERREKILEVIENKDKVSVKELSKIFNDVSPASIRRDLRILESQGMINRSYGYIQLTNKAHIPNLEKKMLINVEEKRRIARAVFKLIEDGD